MVKAHILPSIIAPAPFPTRPIAFLASAAAKRQRRLKAALSRGRLSLLNTFLRIRAIPWLTVDWQWNAAVVADWRTCEEDQYTLPSTVVAELIPLHLDVILCCVKYVNNANFILLLKNSKDHEIISNGVFSIAFEPQ